MTNDDVHTVLHIHEQCLPEYPLDRSALESLLRSRHIGLLVGDVAYALAYVELSLCDILYVACLPDHRRKGHAAMLVDEILCRHTGDTILTVREYNTSAIALYASRGFLPERMHTHVPSLVMRRKARVTYPE